MLASPYNYNVFPIPVVSYINTYIGVLLSALRVRLGTLVALSSRDGVWVPVLPRAPTSHAVGHGPKQTKTSLSRQGQPAVSTTSLENSEIPNNNVLLFQRLKPLLSSNALFKKTLSSKNKIAFYYINILR